MKKQTRLPVLFLLLLFVSCDAPTNNHSNEQETSEANTPPYRVVDVPAEEHGYRNFDSTVLRTGEGLKQFLREHAGDSNGWNRFNEFKSALEKARIDFDGEALVLIRKDATSGNVDVQFDPRVEGEHLVIRVNREAHGDFGTTVMQYFGYAVVVDAERITAVRVESNGNEPKILPIE